MRTAVPRVAAPLAPGSEAPRPRRVTDWLALVLTIGVLAWICLGQDAMKLFWYDELITLHIAGLHSLRDIFQFYNAGKDTTSFLPAMLVHIFQQMHGRPEITDRLPSNLAYLVTCTCIWIFVYRRYAAGCASGALLLFAQGTTIYFASEARAYAFVMMGTAIAMVCWQEANRETRFRGLATMGVFCGLALAILFHFFAIFLLAPFALAEWFYRRTTGRTRWGMWGAILLFPVALAIMLPNLLAARHTYAGSFWSKPTIGLLTDCYIDFMLPVGRDLAEILLILILFVWPLVAGQPPLGDKSVSEDSGFHRTEWVLLLALSFVPVFAFVGAQALGVFRGQYVLYFQLGLLLVAIGAFAETVRRRAAAGWLLAAVMLFLLCIHVRDRLHAAAAQLAGKPTPELPSEYEPELTTFLEPLSLPVVAEGADTLLVIDRYTSPQVRARLLLLTSHERAELSPRAMTNELNMEIFGRDLHLPVEDYDAFVATHRDFLLLMNPQQVEFGWLYRSLLLEEQTRADVRLELVWGASPAGHDQVFLVHFGTPEPLASRVAGNRN